MKKIIVTLLLAVVTLGANAQFEKGTQYSGLSLDGFGIGYSGDNGTGFYLGLSGNYGYFIANQWMLKGGLGFTHTKSNNTVSFNVGGRYYFKQNGLFGGLAAQFEHVGAGRNYFQFVPEFGYCFYLNHYVSIEPAVFANLCCNDFNNGSKIGLKLGVGFYF